MKAPSVLARLETGAAVALLAFPFTAFFTSAFLVLAVVLGCLLR